MNTIFNLIGKPMALALNTGCHGDNYPSPHVNFAAHLTGVIWKAVS